MEKISEQLDEVVLDIFQVLEDLYKKQAELEQVMKDGYFTMARARYNMGVKRVSADQIVDADLLANRTVELKMSDSEEKDSDSDKLQDMFVLCSDKSSGDNGKTSKSSDGDKLKKESDTSLRKRGTGMPSDDLDKELKECLKLIDGGDEGEKKFKRTNPINLFGVLVPQALRSSQTSFEEAVRLIVDVANGKYKLKMLQKKMIDLKGEKSESSRGDDSSVCAENES